MSLSVGRTLAETLVRWGTRRTGRVLLLTLLFFGLGLYGTLQLSVDADLRALLPRDAASVSRLDTLVLRMGTQSDFIVALESPDREANLRFGTALSRRLRELPELRFVQFHRDLTFFRDNALLFLPTGELLDLHRRVVRRIREETRKQMVADLDDDEPTRPAAEDPLEVNEGELVKKYLGGDGVPTEYMEVREAGRHIVVIKARPVQPTTNVAFSTALVQRVKGIVEELNPSGYHPALTVEVKGEYEDRVSQAGGIRTDVLASGLTSLVLLLGVIWLYFRRARAMAIVMVPVLVSTLLTQAVGAVLYGTYNLVTTFIFAIVLGLGIEFGLHTLSRYAHERGRGCSLEEALRISLRMTGAAVTTGGVTTLGVFFLLALGRFRGFSQFGIMAGIGVLLAMLLTFLCLPALTAAIERRWPWQRGKSLAEAQEAAEERAPLPARPITRGMRVAAVLILAASVGFAAFSLAQFRDIPFEYDFTKLGSARAQAEEDARAANPAPPRADFEDAIGEVTTFAPAVALCQDAAECEQVTRLLDAVRRTTDADLAWLRGKTPTPEARVPTTDRARDGRKTDDSTKKNARDSDPDSSDLDDDTDQDEETADGGADPFAALRTELASTGLTAEERSWLRALGPDRVAEMRYFLQAYLGLHQFIPSQQKIKLQIISDMRDRVEAKLALLEPRAREQAETFLRYARARQPVGLKDLPRWVTEQLTDGSGQVGRFIILWNRGAKADYADSKRLHEAFFDLPVGPRRAVPVAANYFVLVEVIDTLAADGPLVLGAAAVAVLLSLIVFFRGVRPALITVLPLCMALAWLAGLYLLTGTKLNLYSVIAFPLLFGMSIDQGVHTFHRWRESPDLWLVLRETGGANVLTTITTVIGFGGLWFADNIGIRSLGTTASVGTVLGLLGAVVTLPSLLAVLSWKRTP